MSRRAPGAALLLASWLALACDLPAPQHPGGAPEVRVVHRALTGRVDVLGALGGAPVVVVHTPYAALLVLPNAMHARVAELAGHRVALSGLVVLERGEPSAVWVDAARLELDAPPHAAEPLAPDERAI